MEAFAFLNINKFAVAWEVYCGMMISTIETKTNSVRPLSVFEASRFRNNDAVWYRNELILDTIRMKNNPTKVSRLTGMYFFRDQESAIRAARDKRWGDGYYDEEFLSNVELFPTREITRVDHNWIFENKIPIKPIDEANIDWINDYWRGKPIANQEPLWELIMDGTAKILDENIRRKALDNIKKLQPETLPLLELSRIARSCGSQLGHIVSWIIPKGDNIGTVAYIIKGEENDEELRKKIKEYNGPVNREWVNENSQYLFPELTKESFNIKINS